MVDIQLSHSLKMMVLPNHTKAKCYLRLIYRAYIEVEPSQGYLSNQVAFAEIYEACPDS